MWFDSQFWLLLKESPSWASLSWDSSLNSPGCHRPPNGVTNPLLDDWDQGGRPQEHHKTSLLCRWALMRPSCWGCGQTEQWACGRGSCRQQSVDSDREVLPQKHGNRHPSVSEAKIQFPSHRAKRTPLPFIAPGLWEWALDLGKSFRRKKKKEQQGWISAAFNNSVPQTDTSTSQGRNLAAGRAALMKTALILVSQQWPSRWNLMLRLCHQRWETSLGKAVEKDFLQQVPKGLGSPRQKAILNVKDS